MEQEQLTETYKKFNHDTDKEEQNERYHDYMLDGHRITFGSLNDLVCSNEYDDRYSSPHYSRYFAESVE